MDLPVCTYLCSGRCKVAGIDGGPCPSDPCCPMYRPKGIKEAAWVDVQSKGMAIVLTEGVEIHRDDADEVEGYVMSGQVRDEGFPVTDGGPYDVILAKRSWENSNSGGWVQGFLCDCLWGRYNSGSPDDPGLWSGRFCSHAYALLWRIGLRARKDFMNDRTASEGHMHCAHCGKPIAPTPNCLCRDCEERATFNHLTAYTLRGDELSLRWLEANAHSDVVDDIAAHSHIEDVGGGIVLASWNGRKTLVTER